MIQIGNKAKIHLHWKVSPYDFSKEKMNNLIFKASKKYGIPKDNISVIPEFLNIDENGKNISITDDVIANIQKPEFQLDLFREYLSVNKIDNYDFDLIHSIDNEINSRIDYDVYDKYKHYSINWIKWSNFLSYGEDNFFDFRTLKGLILLNGEPANQSGKTTFAIDLLHFLLFGKTDKASTQDKIFNKFKNEATEVVVEGSLTIDGEEYIIKRRLTRPQLSKRTARSKTSQKVEYYKVFGDSMEELKDCIDNKQEESSTETNKVIKDAIGREDDFDLIICATSSNLDELIEKKESERGKLLSRWIGLLPLEEKDILAREVFNSKVKTTLMSNIYNREKLEEEIKACEISINTFKNEIERYSKEVIMIDEDIVKLEENKKAMLSAKSVIDASLLKVDITTLNRQIGDIINNGKLKRQQLNDINNELKEIGDVDFSINDYEVLLNSKHEIEINVKLLGEKYNSISNDINSLKNSEFCHTCGRKYDNIDNSSKINELNDTLIEIIKEGKSLKELILLKNKEIEDMKSFREKYDRKSVLTIKKSSIELKIEQLASDYKDKMSLLNEYNKNNEAIDKNNELDIKIRNTELFLRDKRNTREENIKYINNDENEINIRNKEIKDRQEIIKTIINEEILIRNWKIYLEMVGRNGISKMVLRKTLPVINAYVAHLLCDVCDFSVEVSITDKNDVVFYIVKDGIKSDLASASGFEKTAASLALRTVLGNISTIPKLNFFCCDELLGRVAKENYDNMKVLYTKILENYDFIIQISHLDSIRDWHDSIITVVKDNNTSKIVRK